MLLLAAWPLGARADVTFKTFGAVVVDQDVTYQAELCSDGSGSDAVNWSVFYDLSAAPTDTSQADDSATTSGTGCGGLEPNYRTIIWAGAPIGLYKSWARVKPTAFGAAQTKGPIDVCVGPDARITAFEVQTIGASVIYLATICNQGSMAARKFRVGFWHDRSETPGQAEMGNIFEAFTVVEPDECEDFEVAGGLRPNGSFTAWARADSGDFVEECREGNNTKGPLAYSLSNPDLYVKSFDASVADKTVTYKVEVCNKGTAAVSKFFVDVYYHRVEKIPTHDDPGDEAKPVTALQPEACTEVSFTRAATADGDYQSYTQIDADDFVSEPDEGNNLSQMLLVTVGQGGTPPGSDGGVGPTPGGECTDGDGDGHGVGPGCKGVPDCNDSDPAIHPGAQEQCGDGVDDDCDLTPDDGCEGVDCKDGDGDSFGVGADCVLADCDDANKAVFPWAAETCGDNKDDNCNGIADEGCSGRQCVDLDADGYGVGAGCPGAEDCNDKNYFAHPGGDERCGDGIDNDCDQVVDDGCTKATDSDGDGASVGGRAAGGSPPIGDQWRCELQGPVEMIVCTGNAARDPSEVDDGWTCTAAEAPGSWTCQRPRGAAASGQPDCDDQDPNIGPGAKEVCGDGIDNDCDGTVDDGCEGVDCTDGDGDGWGVGPDCAVSDCNDDDEKIKPWAEEVCGDGIDNDCDGTVDDGCEGVACLDLDGDGWGIGKDCARVDCDDNEASISPWQREICGDNKDNDCDRAIDEACPRCTDDDGDGAGIGPKCANWDCDDADPATYAGAEEICDGKDNNCDGVVPEGEDACDAQPEGCSCSTTGAPAALPLLLVGLLALLTLGGRRRRG